MLKRSRLDARKIEGAGLLIICVRTFIHYCNTNNTSTILVMEGRIEQGVLNHILLLLE